MEAMKEVYLPVIATAIKVVAVIVWLHAGLLIVPVSIDQTGIFGPPQLPGNRVRPGEFGEFPAEPTLEYRIRSGVEAAGVLLVVAIVLIPRAFFGRRRALFWVSLALSTLPVLAALCLLAGAIPNIHLPTGQSVGDRVSSIGELLFGAMAAFLIIVLSVCLPASLILNDVVLRRTAATQRRQERP